MHQDAYDHGLHGAVVVSKQLSKNALKSLTLNRPILWINQPNQLLNRSIESALMRYFIPSIRQHKP